MTQEEVTTLKKALSVIESLKAVNASVEKLLPIITPEEEHKVLSLINEYMGYINFLLDKILLPFKEEYGETLLNNSEELALNNEA